MFETAVNADARTNLCSYRVRLDICCSSALAADFSSSLKHRGSLVLLSAIAILVRLSYSLFIMSSSTSAIELDDLKHGPTVHTTQADGALKELDSQPNVMGETTEDKLDMRRMGKLQELRVRYP